VSRGAILAAVRANQPAALPAPAEIPQFAPPAGALLAQFTDTLTRMGGKLAPAREDGGLDALVGALFPDANVVCSATPEVRGTWTLASVAEPVELADVDLGVARAAFGVAETGSVFLSETELRVNALAYLAQHLLVLLDPAEILGNLHQAYRDEGFRTARYAALVTGPSATADIEGVLIHGAQGVRSLTVALVPRPGRGAT